PSFRWAPEKVIPQNLQAAKQAHASHIHALADWRQIAPDKPKNPLDGDDPAYNLSDLDALVQTAPRYNQQVFITISGCPGWSNRGHNAPTGGVSDSTAPATFAHAVSVANPKLPFAAWSTHPYPSLYSLGPNQRVAYPNVGLTNISKLGDSLRQWFHRRVPIWITEWGEQTEPECHQRCAVGGGISHTQQARDARTALEL